MNKHSAVITIAVVVDDDNDNDDDDDNYNDGIMPLHGQFILNPSPLKQF